MDKQLILYSPNPFETRSAPGKPGPRQSGSGSVGASSDLKYLENYEEKTLLDIRFLNIEKISNVSEGEIIVCAKALNILRICAHPYDFIPIYGDTEIELSSTTITTTSYEN